MPTKTLYTPMDGTPPQICLADHGGTFTPDAGTDLRVGTPTNVNMQLDAVANWTANNGYERGAEIDFGAHWALEYRARIAVEIAATPTAGKTIELWMGYCDTTGVGRPGGHTGAVGEYTGYTTNPDASILQLDLISVFVVTGQPTGTVQVIDGWTFAPRGRFGLPVLLNKSGAALHSSAVKMHVVLNPIVEEFQDA